MPIAHVNNTTIHYTDNGAGKPLVFIHGLGADLTMYAPQVETFARTHRVICVDTRGNGQSGVLTGPWQTVLDRQTDDIAALLDHLGLDQVVMIGVSYGGRFTQHFATRHLHRLAGFVVVDSWANLDRHNFTELMLLWLNSQTWLYKLPGKWLVPGVRKQYARWPLARAAVEKIVLSLRQSEAALQRKAINPTDYRPQLRRVQVPVLGIVGDHAEVAVRFMRRFAEAIPGARLEVVQDSFDPTSLCQREIFDRLLADFLTKMGW